MEGMFPGVLFAPNRSVHLQPAMFNCGRSKEASVVVALAVRPELVEGRCNASQNDVD